MATYQEIYQSYLVLSDEELVSIGKDAHAVLLQELSKVYQTEQEILDKYIKIVGSFICIDGTVNQVEYEMFSLISGIKFSYDDFLDIFKTNTSESSITVVDNIIDFLDGNGKYAAIVLGLVLSASNGHMSEEEQKLIEKFIEE